MDKKPIHIVFQVLNEIFSELTHLKPIDKLLLIMLAKHHGVNGIYPTTKTLARELGITPTYIKERINYLDDHKIIKVTRRKGMRHHYELSFLSTDRSTPVDHLQNLTSQPQLTTTGQPQFHNRSTPVDHIYNINNQYIDNNTERHSSVFEPDQKSATLCQQRGFDQNFMVEKFNAYTTMHGKKYKNSQAAFQLFVMNEKVGEANKKSNGNGSTKQKKEVEEVEVCKTCSRPRYWCTCNVSTKETAARQMKDILKKVGINRKETKECLTGESMESLMPLTRQAPR